MVIGGKGAEKDVEIISLGFMRKSCKKPKDFPGSKLGASALYIDKKGIVCGGGNPRSADCFSYNHKSKDWQKSISLQTKRSFAQVRNIVIQLLKGLQTGLYKFHFF